MEVQLSSRPFDAVMSAFLPSTFALLPRQQPAHKSQIAFERVCLSTTRQACHSHGRPAAAALVFSAAVRLLTHRAALSRAARSSLQEDAPVTADDLQGCWKDPNGMTAQVIGTQVHFSDGTSWPLVINELGIVTELRGCSFTGTRESPAWSFSDDDSTRRWTRQADRVESEEAFSRVFLAFKGDQLQLRRQLWAAIRSSNEELAAQLKSAWESGSAGPELAVNFHAATVEQQFRLATGRSIVTGSCFSHGVHGYRGVVVACEASKGEAIPCKKDSDLQSLVRGDMQPFYYCLLDVRDEPSGLPVLVAEENIVLDSDVYPVEHPHIEFMFITCPELNCYFPSPRLATALMKQRSGNRFALMSVL